MTTVELDVTGMHCESCAALIEEVLAEQPGLLTVKVDLGGARAQLTFDNDVTDVGVLQSTIAELGYGSSPVGHGDPAPTP
jgi:copper chaperone CopZ